MKYLVALGAIGVLYVADQAGTVTGWSPLVVVVASILVPATLIAAVAGHKGAGNGR